jgi:hypothetical protein
MLRACLSGDEEHADSSNKANATMALMTPSWRVHDGAQLDLRLMRKFGRGGEI